MIVTTMRDATIELLKNRPAWLTLNMICEQTTIPTAWLNALVKGRMADPSVNRIETLKIYLESKVK